MEPKGYARKEVLSDGSIRYYNAEGKLHREDGPAVEHPDGYCGWYRNGERHRLDGPAVEDADGTKAWYRNGKVHREDGPAVEYPNGSKEYWLSGKQVNHPAVNCGA